MAENKDDTVKLGLALWLSLCLLMCLWFVRGFTKGRQQFQNNLHVIEDGLRKMQENIEMEQRKKSMGYVESLEEITGFLDGLTGSSSAEKESRESVSDDISKRQNSAVPFEEETVEEQCEPLKNVVSGGSEEEPTPSDDKKTV